MIVATGTGDRQRLRAASDHIQTVVDDVMRVIEESAAEGQSFRKASTSPAVGGNPVRSKVARRISVRLSHGGDGLMPLPSSFSRMNESMGVFVHALFLTLGTGGF